VAIRSSSFECMDIPAFYIRQACQYEKAHPEEISDFFTGPMSTSLLIVFHENYEYVKNYLAIYDGRTTCGSENIFGLLRIACENFRRQAGGEAGLHNGLTVRICVRAILQFIDEQADELVASDFSDRLLYMRDRYDCSAFTSVLPRRSI